MKRSLFAAALLLAAAAVHADDLRTGTKQFSFFLTDPSFTETRSQGSNVSGGAGLAFSYVFARQWSAQLSIAAQEHRDVFTRFTPVATPEGTVLFAPLSTVETVRTFPVELLGKYHFFNESRWTPFLGAGVRYVQAPNIPSTFQTFVPEPIGSAAPGTLFVSGPRYGTRTSAELAAGVALRITPSLSLDLEARRLLRSDGLPYDPVNRGVIGLSWRF